MNQIKRAGISLAAIFVGWCLMAAAYDKPQWYFGALGILGAAFCLVAIGWWVVSALRGNG
jgi:hypothetical protein